MIELALFELSAALRIVPTAKIEGTISLWHLSLELAWIAIG
jgi:hypothetical protein